MTRSNVFSLLCMLMLGSMIIGSCIAPKEDTLVITPALTNTKQSVGDGIYMLIPLDYQKKAVVGNASETTSEMIFETKDQASLLISSVGSVSATELKENYTDEQNLAAKGLSLSELSKVKYGTIENAFFAKAYEKASNRFHYILAITKADKTYQVLATCTDITHDFYDSKIRQAMLSVFIADELD